MIKCIKDLGDYSIELGSSIKIRFLKKEDIFELLDLFNDIACEMHHRDITHKYPTKLFNMDICITHLGIDSVMIDIDIRNFKYVQTFTYNEIAAIGHTLSSLK